MTQRPCSSCRILTPDFLLVNNDGLCNTCREKVDKETEKKQTLWAYEYMEIDKRIGR